MILLIQIDKICRSLLSTSVNVKIRKFLSRLFFPVMMWKKCVAIGLRDKWADEILKKWKNFNISYRFKQSNVANFHYCRKRWKLAGLQQNSLRRCRFGWIVYQIAFLQKKRNAQNLMLLQTKWSSLMVKSFLLNTANDKQSTKKLHKPKDAHQMLVKPGTELLPLNDRKRVLRCSYSCLRW